MSDQPLTLYRLQGCPFCERVVRSLQEHGIEYESRFVEARHSRRNAVQRVSGARTVPAVVDPNTGVTMSESANIVEYVETTYGQREREGVRADGGEASEASRPSSDERSESDGSERTDGSRGGQ